MTPQQIEALKLALEALEGFYEYGYDRQECFEHITAIKEALADHAMREVQRLGQEIEQEPVAYPDGDVVGPCICGSWPGGKCLKCPRITTPPQRKPLTEQEIGAILEDINAFGTRLYTFARAIEAAHGIKGEA